MADIDFSRMHVAYFSMEIGINENIPTYSGGLGVLAGDTLRSFADLDLPVLGVTLVYRKGFFTQRLSADGSQHEQDVNWQLSDHLTQLPNRVTVRIEGRDVRVSSWLYLHVGAKEKKVPIIFLDTDLPENSDYDRTITDHLYGNDRRYRLCQEIVLGIGGVKMLKSLGCAPAKYHMNEGHSALLCLELLEGRIDQERIDAIRSRCVFTTHTPVPAGHDEFDGGLARSLLRDYLTPDIEREVFTQGHLNMTHVGLRFSTFVNGVAKKHGEVSREMFPQYQIHSITNGVHAHFWSSPPFRELFDKYFPGWEFDSFSLRYILSVPKQEIWDSHMAAKKTLIDFVNEKYQAGMDLDTFTIGFARRAATYKRGDLLFSDIERLKKIAKGSKGIQIIMGGKAHPQDNAGKDVIRRIFSLMDAVRDSIRVCYIEDYNIEVAKVLIPGVDVWLNTPQRPKEASGTSGMKAAINGVPHFSILDGWWLEGHIEDRTGWSIGPHPKHKDENDNDEDSKDLYAKLETNILPRFYDRRNEWIEIMRHAIAINGSFFNTQRMVQQYVLNAYFK